MRYFVFISIFCCTVFATPSTERTQALLNLYISAYENEKVAQHAAGSNTLGYLSLLKDEVFSSKDEKTYRERLEFINLSFHKNPMALYDLEFALELRWDSRYRSLYLKEIVLEREKLSWVSLTGLGVGLIAAAKNPKFIPSYLSKVRAVYPFFSSIAAYEFTQGRTQSEIKFAPPALYFDHLSSSSFVERVTLEEHDFRELMSQALGVSSSIFIALSTVTHTVKVANAVITPLKINLAVLAGSIVVGLVVEDLASWGYEKWRESELIDEFVRSGCKLLDSRVPPAALILLLNGFITAAQKLEAFYMIPILEATLQRKKELLHLSEVLLDPHEKNLKVQEIEDRFAAVFVQSIESWASHSDEFEPKDRSTLFRDFISSRVSQPLDVLYQAIAVLGMKHHPLCDTWAEIFLSKIEERSALSKMFMERHN